MIQSLRRGLRPLAAAFFIGVLLVNLSAGTEFGLWQRIGTLAGTRQDLGPVNFAALTRRGNQTDSLACPRDACPLAAADLVPPVYTSAASRLKERLRNGLAQESGMTELTPVSDLHLRFVQRSLVMRFPDVVDVLILPRSSGSATLALYSRSAFGSIGSGDNRERIERWLDLTGR